MLLELREYLRARGMATRFVVGLADRFKVEQYAETFGPGTYLDSAGSLKISGGVPHFIVSNKAGKVLQETAGLPSDAGSARDLASAFGLP
jgi:hypothetical protein